MTNIIRCSLCDKIVNGRLCKPIAISHETSVYCCASCCCAVEQYEALKAAEKPARRVRRTAAV